MAPLASTDSQPWHVFLRALWRPREALRTLRIIHANHDLVQRAVNSVTLVETVLRSTAYVQTCLDERYWLELALANKPFIMTQLDQKQGQEKALTAFSAEFRQFEALGGATVLGSRSGTMTSTHGLRTVPPTHRSTGTTLITQLGPRASLPTRAQPSMSISRPSCTLRRSSRHSFLSTSTTSVRRLWCSTIYSQAPPISPGCRSRTTASRRFHACMFWSISVSAVMAIRSIPTVTSKPFANLRVCWLRVAISWW